jgi:hypothetical protein
MFQKPVGRSRGNPRLAQFLFLPWAMAASGMAEGKPWDGYNDPQRFGSGYEFRLERLPLQGRIEAARLPWSESYWPRNQGSINYRWNSTPPVGFSYHSPTREELTGMSLEDLKRLSPSEKYDLYRGRYDYPLKNRISRTESNPRAPDWAGICDGWTAAAIEFREPKPVVRMNPDGIAIPFGSSDVKGLISYTAARQKLNSIVIGRYCPFGLALQFRNCQDINPGTYHVILANEIGIRKSSFPADVDPGKEAWNQPVIGFEFTPVGSARSETGGAAIRIRSRLEYVDELDASRWDPVTGTPAWVSSVQSSEYILELDPEGRITGGNWITSYSHPDVFWRPTKGIEFTGEFANLPELYEPIDP